MRLPEVYRKSRAGTEARVELLRGCGPRSGREIEEENESSKGKNSEQQDSVSRARVRAETRSSARAQRRRRRFGNLCVHPGSVVVLPVLPDGRIVLIRQYRHAAGQYLWELVAGHKEPDEDFRRRRAPRIAGRNRLHGAQNPQAARSVPFPGLARRENGDISGGGSEEGQGAPGRR